MFLPQSDRPSFTPIQDNRQNYSSVCRNLYNFRGQTRRRNILHRMTKTLLSILYFLHFLHESLNFTQPCDHQKKKLRYVIRIYKMAYEKSARRLVDQCGRRSRTLYRKLNKCKCKVLTG